MPEVKLGLEAVLTIDGTEITNVKDLTVSLEKAETDSRTRAINQQRQTRNDWNTIVPSFRDACVSQKKPTNYPLEFGGAIFHVSLRQSTLSFLSN